MIEPQYADPDVFCQFVVGSGRVRASICIYADMWMLGRVATALAAPSLPEEAPTLIEFEPAHEGLFFLCITVKPHKGGRRQLRFRVIQDLLADGAPFRADICFDLSPAEAQTFAHELRAWCEKPEFVFNWKGD